MLASLSLDASRFTEHTILRYKETASSYINTFKDRNIHCVGPTCARFNLLLLLVKAHNHSKQLEKCMQKIP